jgi:hypothetical protein
MGKLLAFPAKGRSSVPSAADSVRAACAAVERRRQQLAQWTGRFWIVLAWLVAVDRIHVAANSGEVFDLGDSLAFLVAVLMPLARARSIFTLLGAVGRALRDAVRSRSRNADADPHAVSKSA